MSSIAVLGAGAWGTALALHAHRLGHQVTLWARHPERIGTENPRLPGIALPPGLVVTNQLPTAADATLVAVPMQHLREILTALHPAGPLLLCCKGVETGTGGLPLEVAADTCPDTPAAILTGPNFAREIAEAKPAAAVIAAATPTLRASLVTLLGAPNFRLYGNADVLGAQLGGAAKNVIAIAAGVVIGAGLGENARAALVTRGVAELSRLVASLGGRSETAAGLSGLGDLVLTCTGNGSRNFRFGVALGQGHPGPQTDNTPVIEGIATAPALLTRAAGIDLPICTAVATLLTAQCTLPDAIAQLLARPVRDE